jgi:hypothetical protein
LCRTHVTSGGIECVIVSGGEILKKTCVFPEASTNNDIQRILVKLYRMKTEQSLRRPFHSAKKSSLKFIS